MRVQPRLALAPIARQTVQERVYPVLRALMDARFGIAGAGRGTRGVQHGHTDTQAGLGAQSGISSHDLRALRSDLVRGDDSFWKAEEGEK